jgi:fumarate reductase subunit C
MNAAWTARLLVAQRLTAVLLAFAVAIHLATIIYAVRAGLNAGEILGRTRGNALFLVFYSLFVIAASIHAPIGLRNILREWASWRGRSLDIAMLAVSLTLLALGLGAAFAVYAA